MADYSGSILMNFSTQIPSCIVGDEITVEFFSLIDHPGTASLSVGSLNIDILPTLYGDYPYATSSIQYGNFISGTEDPNVIIFNESLSSFYGGNYVQVPIFESGSDPNITTVSSSLYRRYSDIIEPFKSNQGDRILLFGNNGKRQELVVFSIEDDNPDGKLRLYLRPNLDKQFLDNYLSIVELLFVRRVRDEQNIILRFKKLPGQTSYGFVISDDADPNLIKSISSIQANVQNQLLSTQQNTQ